MVANMPQIQFTAGLMQHLLRFSMQHYQWFWPDGMWQLCTPPSQQCAGNLIQMAAMPTVFFKIPSTHSFRSPTTNQWTTHDATKPGTQCLSSHLTSNQSQPFYCPLHLSPGCSSSAGWHWHSVTADDAGCTDALTLLSVLCIASFLFITFHTVQFSTQKLSCG
jgi:hypothetical protein